MPKQQNYTITFMKLLIMYFNYKKSAKNMKNDNLTTYKEVHLSDDVDGIFVFELPKCFCSLFIIFLKLFLWKIIFKKPCI